MVLGAVRKNASMVRRAFRSGHARDGLIPFVGLVQRFGLVAAPHDRHWHRACLGVPPN